MTHDAEALAAAPTTANLADACDRLGIAPRHVPFAPLTAGMRVAGPVRPAIHRGSVDVFFAAMEEAARGDVLVIDNDGRLDEGCVGDLTVLEAQAYGLAGAVVFGAHRDTAELRSIGLPLFSLGACALGPRAMREAREGRPCTIGTFAVTEHDFVFGDDDGVLFVDAHDLGRVVEAARAIRDQERRQADLVRAGTTLHDQFRWTEYVEAARATPGYTFRAHLKRIGRAIEE